MFVHVGTDGWTCLGFYMEEVMRCCTSSTDIKDHGGLMSGVLYVQLKAFSIDVGKVQS